jgi:lipopolysaccharide transport system permease protein
MGYRRPDMQVPAPVSPKIERLEILASPNFTARSALAARDVVEGFGLWRLCWTLSWLDIKLRYRGSLLGPFWLTLSTAVMIGSMGFLYASLFHMDLHEYLPFLALSLVLWNFLGALVGDACICFTSAEGMIRAVRLPFSLYGGRVVMRNLLVLAHNIVVIVVVDVLLDISPGAVALLAIPAFLLWLVVGLALSVLLGAICARFRDIPPIIASIMQMAFFVSAVIWRPEQLKDQEYLLIFNPFYTLLEIVRGPLLGDIPSTEVYLSALVFTVLVLGIAWLLFSRVRGRIAFWV